MLRSSFLLAQPVAPAPVVHAPPPAAVVPPAPILPPPPEHIARMNAINLSVLGFVIGNIRVTHERLLSPKHGVLAEAIVAPDNLKHTYLITDGELSVGYSF